MPRDTTPEPVLVLHGIAIRDRPWFEALVARFNAAVGERCRMVPVFWGDLGARDEDIERVLPRGSGGAGPRALFTRQVLPFVADALVYQGAAGRRRIHRRVREALPPGYGTEERPIAVVAHSLGGVIAFDMAVSGEDPVRIRHLFTFGTQASFFHLQDPRPGLEEAPRGKPVALPPTIRRWTNFRDRHDWLSFRMRAVFRLHDGGEVEEVEVQSGLTALDGFLRSHLAYWENPDVIRAVRRGLARR